MHASIHAHPYKNAAGCRLMCNKTAPWEIGVPNGPGHLSLPLCDQHAREIVRNIPDELMDEVLALVADHIQQGTEWGAKFKEMAGGSGLPGVSDVVTEVQKGSEWGSALLEALLPALEPEGEGAPKEPGTRYTPPTSGGYTVHDDGTIICACGKTFPLPRSLSNWNRHKPHCKGPKTEGAQS